MKSDGHELWVAMPHKLPRNGLDVFGVFVFLTHVDPGGETSFISYSPINILEVGSLQGLGARHDACYDFIFIVFQLSMI